MKLGRRPTWRGWAPRGDACRALTEGDLVILDILDNLGSHKGAAARKKMKAAGARMWFPPPYSPDLNPIEMVFAKLKLWLRDAAARTVEATWRKIDAAPDRFSPDECGRYLAHCGYAPTSP